MLISQIYVLRIKGLVKFGEIRNIKDFICF